MHNHQFTSGGLNLPYIETGDGPPLHFAHANGFPAAVYSKIINEISRHHTVLAVNHCSRFRCDRVCTTRPEKVQSWDQIAGELIEFLDHKNMKPYIGVGHSLGGVSTMIASVKRPDLFSKIIMLDPVLLPKSIINMIRVMRIVGQGGKFPLAVRARKRRDGWKSVDEVRSSFRDKPLFKNWDDDIFDDYLKFGLVHIDGQVRLFCPPETEAQTFESYCLNVWNYVKRVTVPVTIIRGENSDTLFEKPWKLFAKLRPEADMLVMPGAGHLFPMEKPNETIREILSRTSPANQ